MLLTDTQFATLSIAPKNRKGNPAHVDGIPVWTNSNDAVATLAPSADGMGATLTAVAEGDTAVTVVLDADLGAGVREITGNLDVTVLASEATIVEIVAGLPEEQP